MKTVKLLLNAALPCVVAGAPFFAPFFTPMAAAQATAPAVARVASTWDERDAEHLFNRAGFGARPNEISYALRMPREQFVDQLLAGFAPAGDPFFLDAPERPQRRDFKGDEEQYRKLNDAYRAKERELMIAFTGWWFDQMLEARDPLREKMVLFWHGHFTSSVRVVKSSAAMITQNELFRRHALGNFRDLVAGIVRDPAMLAYLDNNQNRKGNPNENLARELMELFTLGVGNYTEDDIKEAARALTGWQTREGEGAFFVQRQHDNGVKTILGRTGRFDADDLVDILLDQPACPRWIAARLLLYFEGREPSERRLAEYAAFLKAQKYELAPFLRKLFLDAQFYSDEIVAERIAGPVEFLVGATRRLGITIQPQVLWLGAGQLGQRLFEPPNVKGWEGGEAWVTTSTLLARGNMAGMLLGAVRIEDVIKDDSLEFADEPSMGGEMQPSGDGMTPSGGDDSMTKREARKEKKVDLGQDMSAMRRLLGAVYFPRLNLTARAARANARSDAQIVDLLADELLPVELTTASRAPLIGFLEMERAMLGNVADGKLLDAGTKAESVLRRLAHLILSLPEAQLG